MTCCPNRRTDKRENSKRTAAFVVSAVGWISANDGFADKPAIGAFGLNESLMPLTPVNALRALAVVSLLHRGTAPL